MPGIANVRQAKRTGPFGIILAPPCYTRKASPHDIQGLKPIFASLKTWNMGEIMYGIDARLIYMKYAGICQVLSAIPLAPFR